MPRRFPPLTLTLIGLCVAWTLLAAVAKWTPHEAGALRNRELWQGDWWRLVTATFLHHTSFWAHLVLNGLSLYVIGRVLERGCGKAIVGLAVLGSATLGFALSLLWPAEGDYWRMGISGAVAGLLGLILAIEWAVTRSFGEFLRQRNTILVLFFVGLSVPFALVLQKSYEGVVVDHAGHAGGLLFGLLAGLAYYSRRGRRPVRGAVVALLLALVPVAYAARPVFNPVWLLWAGTRAYHAGEMEAAVDYFERGLARLPADYRPDADDASMIQRASLLLARSVHAEEPERAQALVARAYGITPGDPDAWLEFAEWARQEGLDDTAYDAYQHAAEWFRLAGRASEQWRARAGALDLLGRRPALLAEAADTVVGALQGLAQLDGDARRAHEDRLARATGAIAASALLLGTEEEGAEGLARRLGAIYRLLAENTRDDARRPLYRYRSAWWAWRGGELSPEETQARFRAALEEAVEEGDSAVALAAREWFRGRGLAPPDLAGSTGGG